MPVFRDPATEGEPLYECVACGARTDEPDGRRCECGGELQNIAVPRPQ